MSIVHEEDERNVKCVWFDGKGELQNNVIGKNILEETPKPE